MARDATATRELLIVAGERLMATHGPLQVSLKQIQDAAGQRNASALHYHFGGREGLLQAILARHNATIESARAGLLDRLEAGSPLSSIVEAVVLPMAAELSTEEGRYFLRIVAQLSDLFELWDTDGDNVPAQAQRAFRMIAARLAGLSPDMCRLRVATFLALVTGALAQRAVVRTKHELPRVSDDDFVVNLIAMSVGALMGGLPSE
jgi:TetR/AcrR family transcriptional regulator, regulator of cefoperazone and chloramphenicol sensitivity